MSDFLGIFNEAMLIGKVKRFSSCTICILYTFNIRPSCKMLQVVSYVIPSCCELPRIDCLRFVRALSTADAVFSSMRAGSSLFG